LCFEELRVSLEGWRLLLELGSFMMGLKQGITRRFRLFGLKRRETQLNFDKLSPDIEMEISCNFLSLLFYYLNSGSLLSWFSDSKHWAYFIEHARSYNKYLSSLSPLITGAELCRLECMIHSLYFIRFENMIAVLLITVVGKCPSWKRWSWRLRIFGQKWRPNCARPHGSDRLAEKSSALAMLKFHFETFFHIQKHKSYGHLNFWCRKFWRPISREDEGQGNLKFWFWQFFMNVNKCAKYFLNLKLCRPGPGAVRLFFFCGPLGVCLILTFVNYWL